MLELESTVTQRRFVLDRKLTYQKIHLKYIFFQTTQTKNLIQKSNIKERVQ